MNNEEIIAMARQAGFSEWAVQTPNDLIAFAKLVADKERERIKEDQQRCYVKEKNI